MSLRTEIENKLQNALKERDKVKISTLRLVIAAIKDRDIAVRTNDNKSGIQDDDIKQLLKKMIKQRNESIEIYKKNNRNDLLETELKETEVIRSFLPKQLTDDEVLKICKDAIKSVGAVSTKDIGKVMGLLKKKYSDTIDFAKAGSAIKDLLK